MCAGGGGGGGQLRLWAQNSSAPWGLREALHGAGHTLPQSQAGATGAWAPPCPPSPRSQNFQGWGDVGVVTPVQCPDPEEPRAIQDTGPHSGL